MSSASKPNILLIITDQQFAGAMSVYDHPDGDGMYVMADNFIKKALPLLGINI